MTSTKLISALLENSKEIQQELQFFLKEQVKKRKEVGFFGEKFYSVFDEYNIYGGKRIRPFLVRTAFNAVRGDNSQGNITRAALSIELLHNGSLLHDDVIDKDEIRRGEPSFHVVFRDYHKNKRSEESYQKAVDFGNAMAIFAGDLCFPYAIESILTSGFPSKQCQKALHAFNKGFHQVIDGVVLEIGETILKNLTQEEYNLIIELKTSALIKAAVEIGASLGNGTISQINALKKYCSGIGSAFQIQDDLLGIFGEQEKLGKPIGGDIREDKQTLLRIYAFNNGNEKQVKQLSKLMGKNEISKQELQTVQEIFKDTGAVDFAKEQIRIETEKAINALNQAEPQLDEEYKNLLVDLAKYLMNRMK
jgi:geranylgeranyl diphosphate synthase type I